MAFTSSEENWLKGWRLRFLSRPRPDIGGNGWDAADALLARVQTLEGRQENLTTELTDLEDDVTTVTADQETLDTRVKALEDKPEPVIPTDVLWPGVLA